MPTWSSPQASAYARRRYADLSPDEKRAYIEKVRERQRNLPPEKKAEYRERQRATRAAMPEAAKEALRAAQRAAYAAAKAAAGTARAATRPGSWAAEDAARKQKVREGKRARVAPLRAGLQAEVTAMKAGFGCSGCGERNPAALQFHHRNPAEKHKNISELVRDGNSTALWREIRKCTVLCATCHAKAHAATRACDLV